MTGNQCTAGCVLIACAHLHVSIVMGLRAYESGHNWVGFDPYSLIRSWGLGTTMKLSLSEVGTIGVNVV